MSNKAHENFLQLLSGKIGQSFVQDLPKLGAMSLLYLESQHWQQAAMIAAELSYRFVAVWAQDLAKNFELNISLELHGSYLLLRVLIDSSSLSISSFTPYFPAANRLERHTHDMFGIDFADHPDKRRWTRHQAWSEEHFPLHKKFSVTPAEVTSITPADNSYPFAHINGAGVYEIPVGPVHAGIIEPGHFRFHAAGEDVLSLEEHLGYTHKGVEKIAERCVAGELVKIAGRVSGDSTVAYAWSVCMALESAANLEISERAACIRAVMCERERISNHLGDFAGVCNDVAYTFGYYQLMRLKELWLRLSGQIFGHRFMMDCIVPGGVAVDLNSKSCQDMLEQIISFRQELDELYPIFEENSGFHDRIKTTGVLSVEQAAQLGVVGYVGRASGCKFDLRSDAPYSPYDKLKVHVPLFNTGDVLARVRVRAQEIAVAFELIEKLLDKLPSDGIYKPWVSPSVTVEGVGLVEGWRGEILTFVRLGSDGLVERYFPRDPSWFSWPALEKLIHGNIVPDFPVCNKSINGSYSAVDL